MRPLIPLQGKQFGRWFVVSRAEDVRTSDGKIRPRWHVRCDCGAPGIVDGRHLRGGNSTSCGCAQREGLADRRVLDLKGMRFGKLEVIARAHNKPGKARAMWIVKCDCESAAFEVDGCYLTRGSRSSCGCTPNAPPTAEQRRYAKDKVLKHLYGSSIEAYEEMFAKQNGVCAICGTPESGRAGSPHLVVDHDHNTGSVRSLLCGNCNKGLGMFREDPKKVRAAARYLEKHRLLHKIKP